MTHECSVYTHSISSLLDVDVRLHPIVPALFVFLFGTGSCILYMQVLTMMCNANLLIAVDSKSRDQQRTLHTSNTAK
jgi:hypothetical protein